MLGLYTRQSFPFTCASPQEVIGRSLKVWCCSIPVIITTLLNTSNRETSCHLTSKWPSFRSFPEDLLCRTVWIIAKTKPKSRIWKYFSERWSQEINQQVRKCNREGGTKPIQFSHFVMFDSLRPHELQHASLPCPPTPRVYWNSCPSSRWCHPTISFSVIPFSSHLQSFPASGSFQMSQFFTSGGQSIRVSASALVLPMNIQDWFPLGWTGWISLQSKGLSRIFSTPQFKSINSILSKWLYYPKQSIDSMQSLSSYQWYFSQN